MRAYFIYIILAVFGIFIFSSSFGQVALLREQENWIQTSGTVIHADIETYRNSDYDPDDDPANEEYLSRVTYTYEFTREDGTLDSDTDVIDGFPADSPSPRNEGDVVDVIYDPNGTGVSQSDLPELGDYIIAYIFRAASGALLIVLAVFGVRWIYRRLKYDSGSRRIL